MSDIKAIPKKCQDCDKKTTTRQRQWMCPEFHEVIEGKHIPLCEHPNILTKQQLEEKIKTYEKEIQDLERQIRSNKEDIRNTDALIEDERRFIREVKDELDPYEREYNRRSGYFKLTTDDMVQEGIRIHAIEFREYLRKNKNPKRNLVILFKDKSGNIFGRNIEQFTEGHSCHHGIGIPNDIYKKQSVLYNLDLVDPVIDSFHEAFIGWMLCKKEC